MRQGALRRHCCTLLWVVAFNFFFFCFCTAACSGLCALPKLGTVIEIAYPSHHCKQTEKEEKIKTEVCWLCLPVALAATILVYAMVGSAQACHVRCLCVQQAPLGVWCRWLACEAPGGARTTRMRASLCFFYEPPSRFSSSESLRYCCCRRRRHVMAASRGHACLCTVCICKREHPMQRSCVL